MAEDSASNGFHSVALSNQPDDRPAFAVGCVYLLCVSRHAVSGWVRDALTRYVARLLHLLQVIAKRNQLISTHRASVHARVLGTKESMPLEYLSFGDLPRSLTQYPSPVGFLCSTIAGHVFPPS